MTGREDPGDAGIRQAIFASLSRVAPEVDPSAIDPSKPLRDQADLDSMDFLNFVIGLHTALGVEIPEADYSNLTTIDRMTAYLGSRLATGNAGA